MRLVARQATSLISVIRFAFVCAHEGHIFLLRYATSDVYAPQAKDTKP